MCQHWSGMHERLLLQTYTMGFAFNVEWLWLASITHNHMQFRVAESKHAARKSAVSHMTLYGTKEPFCSGLQWGLSSFKEWKESLWSQEAYLIHAKQEVTAKAIQPMLQLCWLLLPSFPRSQSAALKTTTTPRVPSVPIHLTRPVIFSTFVRSSCWRVRRGKQEALSRQQSCMMGRGGYSRDWT